MKRSLFLLFLFSTQLPAQFEHPLTWKEVAPSETTFSAVTLRTSGQSYLRSIQFVQPHPATTPDELTQTNPHLPKVLPDFARLMASAEVSSRYAELYQRKLAKMRQGELLTSHNYFDCETVLRLQHPDSGREVLLLQADMDVVTDGSDPQCAAKLSDYDRARSSDWYLPETAYSWRHSGEAANPFLSYYPEALSRLEKLRRQLETEAQADPGVVWRELLKTCDAQIYRLKARGLSEGTQSNLRNRRFLLAERDPFVVLPIPWINKKAAWSPKMGDYAAVIYQDRIYPAILGDAGPAHKVGEASLRLARELNTSANGKTRAVSDLAVTYLFFPNTRTPAGEPDLTLWHRKVSALLEDLGGLGPGVALHTWTTDKETTPIP